MREYGSYASDGDTTQALRALYAAPAGHAYWSELESRVMARVAAVEMTWWDELDRRIRPALALAAVLIVAAAIAMFRAHQEEVNTAYGDILNPPPIAGEPIDAAARPTLQDPLDQALRFGLNHPPR